MILQTPTGRIVAAVWLPQARDSACGDSPQAPTCLRSSLPCGCHRPETTLVVIHHKRCPAATRGGGRARRGACRRRRWCCRGGARCAPCPPRRDDDPVRGEGGDERVHVGRADAHERPAPRRVARRGHRRAELVEAVEQPVDEPRTCVSIAPTPASSTSERPATPAWRRTGGVPESNRRALTHAASSRRWTWRRCPRRRTTRSGSRTRPARTSGLTHMNPSPAVPSGYLTVPPVTTSAPSERTSSSTAPQA